MIRLQHWAILGISLLVCACSNRPSTHEKVRDWEEIKQGDTLRILTLYSPSSYFLYKGEEMGYEHDLIVEFAQKQGLIPQFIVAANQSELIEKLNAGEGDIIAYNLPRSKTLQKEIAFTGIERITRQVLVQRRKRGIPPLRDVTQLVGKELYVESGSKYDERARHLNNELGGGIDIRYVNRDTLTTEDLMDMVASGEIDYTLADDNIAKLNKSFNGQLDVALEVSFPQRSSWAIRKSSVQLKAILEDWREELNHTPSYKTLLKRYYEESRRPPRIPVLSPKEGIISPYDALFKKYAAELEWDWELLAAQAYSESQFDTLAKSWAGAQGLMQLMPQTAYRYGLKEGELTNPEKSIAAATRYIAALNEAFKEIEAPQERFKFVLAAYNVGIGHVLDAIALAKKYGKDPTLWEGHVEKALRWKSNPEYFNDPVCRFGYLHGKETLKYVYEVISYYNYYKTITHKMSKP